MHETTCPRGTKFLARMRALRSTTGDVRARKDYDDNQLLGWTILNGGDDMGPFGLLHMTNKTLT